MAFAPAMAGAGVLGLAAHLASKKKKKTPGTAAPSMISISPTASPTSMVGSTRGGYG